jgi:hypothetical protein
MDEGGMKILAREKVPGPISPRLAGIWGISFGWLDERECQDRPALRINRQETSFAACPENSTFTIQH